MVLAADAAAASTDEPLDSAVPAAPSPPPTILFIHPDFLKDSSEELPNTLILLPKSDIIVFATATDSPCWAGAVEPDPVLPEVVAAGTFEVLPCAGLGVSFFKYAEAELNNEFRAAGATSLM
jgi:hypothetical protein